jgi:methylated-DNA-protein-cysteine methyltransferase related protein
MTDPHSFFDKVYDIVRQVPFGRVTSYGAIAECIGSKGSSRMVGWAMNASHSSQLQIPAHRVVNRQGVLTGRLHFGHPGLMQQLLENEGISIIDNKIVNFKDCFWNPVQELDLLR